MTQLNRPTDEISLLRYVHFNYNRRNKSNKKHFLEIVASYGCVAGVRRLKTKKLNIKITSDYFIEYTKLICINIRLTQTHHLGL